MANVLFGCHVCRAQPGRDTRAWNISRKCRSRRMPAHAESALCRVWISRVWRVGLVVRLWVSGWSRFVWVFKMGYKYDWWWYVCEVDVLENYFWTICRKFVEEWLVKLSFRVVPIQILSVIVRRLFEVLSNHFFSFKLKFKYYKYKNCLQIVLNICEFQLKRRKIFKKKNEFSILKMILL